MILGDTTWGKGTVQILKDLDELSSADEDLKPLGTVKPTIQKFYRVSGGSTQLRGVVPDVLLPDAYTDLDIGERSMEYALPYDTIPALRIHRWKDMPLDQIKARSRARIAANPYFQRVNDYLGQQEAIRKRKFVSLSLSAYFAEREHNRDEADTMEALQKKATDLTVETVPTRDDTASALPDSAAQEKAKSWKEQLGRDFYLREGVNIVDDWAAKKK